MHSQEDASSRSVVGAAGCQRLPNEHGRNLSGCICSNTDHLRTSKCLVSCVALVVELKGRKSEVGCASLNSQVDPRTLIAKKLTAVLAHNMRGESEGWKLYHQCLFCCSTAE
eukprot:3958074-Amphidinium_carterae.1